MADTVMGGVSGGSVTSVVIGERTASRLTGRVSLENNGGFIQMAGDVQEHGGVMDAGGWTGVELDVIGNGEVYDLRLRTDQLTRPWQSFRAEFRALRHWRTVRLPFTEFMPHRTGVQFDPARLRRIGIVAIGREFEADFAVSSVRFYGSGAGGE